MTRKPLLFRHLNICSYANKNKNAFVHRMLLVLNKYKIFNI